jgi:hypothetical protein
MNSNKVAAKKKAIREAKLAAKEAGTAYYSKRDILIAHHEAAHAIASLHNGCQFQSIHIFPASADGEQGLVDQGTEGLPWATTQMFEDMCYAGAVSDAILEPEKDYAEIMNGRGRGDLLAISKIYVNTGGAEPTPEQLGSLFRIAIPRVEKIIKGRWEDVKTLAFALLENPNRELSYEHCLNLFPHYRSAADEYKERARAAIEQRDAATVTAA